MTKQEKVAAMVDIEGYEGRYAVTPEGQVWSYNSLCNEDIDAIMLLIKQDRAASKREAEVALARKVLSVANYKIYRRGITMRKRLDLLISKMDEIIPDVFGIEDEQLTTNSEAKPPNSGELESEDQN